MNYILLEKIRKEKHLTAEQISARIKMTRTGYNSAIKNKTLTVDKLEAICVELNEQPCTFFECIQKNENSSDEFKIKYFDILERYNKKLEEMTELQKKLSDYEFSKPPELTKKKSKYKS